ncbi:18006_t:CDS:1, partial [Rhizophagus irregularis]
RRRQRFINRRIQSIQRQRRRIINRTYRRRVLINNTSTFLLRIAQLQSFSDQLFNGSSFH